MVKNTHMNCMLLDELLNHSSLCREFLNSICLEPSTNVHVSHLNFEYKLFTKEAVEFNGTVRCVWPLLRVSTYC